MLGWATLPFRPRIRNENREAAAAEEAETEEEEEEGEAKEKDRTWREWESAREVKGDDAEEEGEPGKEGDNIVRVREAVLLTAEGRTGENRDSFNALTAGGKDCVGFVWTFGAVDGRDPEEESNKTVGGLRVLGRDIGERGVSDSAVSLCWIDSLVSTSLWNEPSDKWVSCWLAGNLASLRTDGEWRGERGGGLLGAGSEFSREGGTEAEEPEERREGEALQCGSAEKEEVESGRKGGVRTERTADKLDRVREGTELTPAGVAEGEEAKEGRGARGDKDNADAEGKSPKTALLDVRECKGVGVGVEEDENEEDDHWESEDISCGSAWDNDKSLW